MTGRRQQARREGREVEGDASRFCQGGRRKLKPCGDDTIHTGHQVRCLPELHLDLLLQQSRHDTDGVEGMSGDVPLFLREGVEVHPHRMKREPQPGRPCSEVRRRRHVHFVAPPPQRHAEPEERLHVSTRPD